MAKVKSVTPVSANPTEQQKEETMHNHKKTTAKSAKKTTAKKTTAKKYDTKKDHLIALATKKSGITRDQVIQITGWKEYKSVRGFFSTLKTIHRDTYDVNTTTNKQGETVYHVSVK